MTPLLIFIGYPPITAIVGFAHFLVGNVDLFLMFNLLIGSIPGILIGASLVKCLPDKFLRIALAVDILAAGIRLFYFA